MRKSKSEAFSVTDWWLPARILRQPEVFPSGFCSHAEHWYLALLILISQDPHLQSQGLKIIQKRAHAKRIDTPKKVQAPGMVKVHAQSRGKKYFLGYDSFLILNGPLAGTLADYEVKKGVLRRKKLELHTVRPLMAHSAVTDELEIDIDTYTGLNNHLTALLEKAHSEILKRGYIQAVLYYLGKTGLRHSKRKIMENQRKLEDFLH